MAHFSINPSYHEPILRRGMGRLARAYLALHVSLMAAIPGTVCQGASEFYRGINCNGPELMIDGHAWESGHKAQNFSTSGKSFENQSVKLHPITDPSRSTMLRSSYWGSKVDLNLEAVPDGPVQIFLYIWEDNHSEQFELRVNGKTVIHKFHSGSAGQWKKLGPWLTQADQGRIQITAQGPGHGAANLSGLEIWIGEDPIPDPNLKRFVANPSPDQVEFFEKRVRGILAEHCYECHSSQAREIKGGLVLDSRIGVMAGGASGPVIIPGDPDSSPLIHAIRKFDADFSMPPKTNLSEFEIGALMEWVEMGAPDPRMEDTVALARKKSTIDWEEARQWWSFQPIRNPQAPAVENGDWPTSPIDRFLLAEMEKNGLTPAPDVEKSTLLRRLSYDLTGLPPSPEDIEAFLRDPSEDAYHAYVEKLLASPHYGERWGRHWLDVVRYADTAGDNSDFPIPQHFLYRNWVIDALNQDYPYDLFIRDQIAGDLVTSENQTDKFQKTIATGYIANARRFGSRVDDYPQHLTIEDTIDNLGKSFLGLTVQCARCHDHKFDPISIDDYYGLFGIFHSTRYPWPGIELDQKQRDLVPLASPQEWTQAQNRRNDEINRLEQTIKKLENDLKSASESQKPELNQALREAGKSRDQLKKRPLPLPMAYAVAEAPVIEDVPVQLKGDPARPDRLVPRRFLSILGGEKVPESEGRSGRLHLAHWLTSPTNPLTARVMVNRIWLHHFGKAIVPTPNDFGRQGKPPTHPELLDYLATQFVESGWSIKAMHRLIVHSRAYRLSSRAPRKSLESDPANDWLSFFPRRRLDAESIRDTLLVLGGNLDESRDSPHPFPAQSEWKFTQHNPFKAVYDTRRRSVYLMTQRIQRHPFLAIFDGADPAASTPVRSDTTTPLQALYLLNDAFVHDQAKHFAAHLIAQASTFDERLDTAWMAALARKPSAGERADLHSFARELRGPLQHTSTSESDLEMKTWEAMARMIFKLNEFVFID